MYSTCLFCSASLGRNEAIETFSVGRSVAFDAWQGRLWAVCQRCGRWNLAPIEERWEAVELAERLFVDTRTRVHSENIGLCRLPDGTRLVRVGKALPGELAAWRYGTQLTTRRRRSIAIATAGGVGTVALIGGIPLLASAGLPFVGVQLGLEGAKLYNWRRQRMRIVHRLSADQSPTGEPLTVRRIHLHDAALTRTAGDAVGVTLPFPRQPSWLTSRIPQAAAEERPAVQLTGHAAQRVLSKAMQDYNAEGATGKEIRQALGIIEAAGGAEPFALAMAAAGAGITKPELRPRKTKMYTLRQIAGTFRGEILPLEKNPGFRTGGNGRDLDGTRALALEMALNEEAERRALEGELAALEAAWREAEEIAGIADSLAAPPLPGRDQQQE
jgi:hypothetical protein